MSVSPVRISDLVPSLPFLCLSRCLLSDVKGFFLSPRASIVFEHGLKSHSSSCI